VRGGLFDKPATSPPTDAFRLCAEGNGRNWERRTRRWRQRFAAGGHPTSAHHRAVAASIDACTFWTAFDHLSAATRLNPWDAAAPTPARIWRDWGFPDWHGRQRSGRLPRPDRLLRWRAARCWLRRVQEDALREPEAALARSRRVFARVNKCRLVGC
jgi:hypothetical protein